MNNPLPVSLGHIKTCTIKSCEVQFINQGTKGVNMADSEDERTIDITSTIGEYVAEDYRTAKVFEKYGIDFCCGGKASLSAVCGEKGIDTDAILRELADVKSATLDRGQNYAAWEESFLADYIINTHHAYLKVNLEQIAVYLSKIAAVHGARHPEVIKIARIFYRIASDMAAHLREEEEVLFPAIKRVDAALKAGAEPEGGDIPLIRESLEKLKDEHEKIGDAVHTIRRLSKGYVIPDDACNTYMLTYQKLREFEEDLHMHVHLENNILFPKAARH